MISRGLGQILASTAAASLTISPAMAKSASTLQDLIDARAGQAEGTLTQRGWAYVTGNKSAPETHGYWWNASRKDCVKVTTREGRYAAIDDTGASDCNQKSSGSGAAVAVAAVGAVALTALLLSRKTKDKPGNDYRPDWQHVEVYDVSSSDTLRIFNQPSKKGRVVGRVRNGAILRNFGCEEYKRESWCEVATMDGYAEGWARDRYLRPAQSVNPGYPGGGDWGDGGWGGNYRGTVEVYGTRNDRLKITASPSKNSQVVARVAEGTTLRSLGCQSISGDNWCEVTSINGGDRGWARERYLRRR